jgi:hypothetical protein
LSYVVLEIPMDVFWVIPSAIVGILFVWILYSYIKRLPETPGSSQVLLDKKTDEPAIHPSITESRDWSDRPCGSVLDARTGKAAASGQALS